MASSGRMNPGMVLISSVAPLAVRGGFLSVQSSVQQLGSGTAAFVGGFIITILRDGRLADNEYIGYLGMLARLICTVLVRFVKPVDAGKPAS